MLKLETKLDYLLVFDFYVGENFYNKVDSRHLLKVFLWYSLLIHVKFLPPNLPSFYKESFFYGTVCLEKHLKHMSTILEKGPHVIGTEAADISIYLTQCHTFLYF